jgi:hypothetical protein
MSTTTEYPLRAAVTGKARCYGHDHEHLSRSAEDGPDSALMIRRARRRCALCPVREPCLLLALLGQPGYDGDQETRSMRTPEPVEGVWAGTTREEREAVGHLPQAQQVRVLLRQFRRKAVGGPFPVVSAGEWVA